MIHKIKLLACIFSGSLLLSACSDFLEEIPMSNTATTGNFYKNDLDIRYALNAAYAELQTNGMYSTDLVLMTDVRSDDLETFVNSGGNAGREYSIKMFSASSDNQIFRDVWAEHYKMIYQCNQVIANINVVKSESLRKQYEAEARFLRALTYFNIVRLWGDAPLILVPMSTKEVAECHRNASSEVYSSIEEDLTFASNDLNLAKSFSGANVGRATSLAAKGLLGKVYLQQKKWSEAKRVLDELINKDNDGKHGLLSDIANVFSTAPAHGSKATVFKSYTGWNPQLNNKEILFQVQYSKDITGEGRGALTYYCNQADINEVFKATSAKCIYDKNDRRSDLMLCIKGTNKDNSLLVKYGDIISSIKQYQYSCPILRWSDVLLMYAEACNEVGFDNSESGPAMKSLNAVRTRSFADGGYKSSDLTNQEIFRNAIFLERRLEFPMEMQRWFDLLRSGKAIEAIGAIGINIDNHDLLFPVPYNEIKLRDNKDAFPQNPGY